MHEPQPQTIRAAAAGDDAAFADLVRQVQAHVWRFLVHLVGDPDLAADLTQDTLVKAHAGLPQFRFESSLSTWMLRIARNCATDHHRRQARHLRVVDAATSVATRSPTHLAIPDPSDALEVRYAIQSLRMDLRETFVLVEVFGLRYREVAVVLDLPIGTVKSRMFAAREALVAWFAAEDGTEVADGGR